MEEKKVESKKLTREEKLIIWQNAKFYEYFFSKNLLLKGKKDNIARPTLVAIVLFKIC